ncbi:copper amine oxidase N-terminal domain-containing protein [Paenibacillus endoradicis]|uniref:copper amine oxidase N-terminal domain-containing protein n=1 Tax=Paenibacillus endoradicis TaxID=2972487 RepID=UPI0021596235|nr:copper amine oxidase N-terminal domain-containing protein [Paenibacillus endoradicis]MCR8656913.1 copper amine oxidase N-terminal domain-containing protein [Paenibacillus endoradicis]
MIKVGKERLKGFLLGIAVMLFVVVGVTSVGAASKLITIQVVKGGITLYVDGKLAKPTDANGKVVEPIIYEGTTYLPLRATSNLLTNGEKEVTWDGKTSTIYIGEAPVAEQTDITELTAINSFRYLVEKGSSAKFSILGKEYTPFNALKTLIVSGATYGPPGTFGEGYYMLDSKYSELKGILAYPFDSIDELKSEITHGVTFYSVNQTGDEILLGSQSVTASDNNIPVSIDLRGVNILKIEFDSFKHLFYNVTLQGMENSFSK